MCKAPVKSSPSTNQYPMFYRPDALPVTQSTVSEDSWGKKANSRTVIEFRRYTLNANMWPSNFWRILMSVWFQNYDSQNEHSGSQNFCGHVRDKIILAVFNSSQHVLLNNDIYRLYTQILLCLFGKRFPEKL